MKTRIAGSLALVCLAFLSAAKLEALANRVFVSARSGNDSNSCDNINTPCQTLQGAVNQTAPFGEVIVLDSGGYGPVMITRSVTIDAPPGVVAFIHPPSGDAIWIDSGPNYVITLRGLFLNDGSGNGITVNTFGQLNVENCFITGFVNGIEISGSNLNMKGTDITACGKGVDVNNFLNHFRVSIDHCHLDGNLYGFYAESTNFSGSIITASNSTANNNAGDGWVCGIAGSNGRDVLNLEFCTGSENGFDGLHAASTDAVSATRYSNCVFANNGFYGVVQENSSTVETRGNNTITGNVLGPTSGTIGSFSPM